MAAAALKRIVVTGANKGIGKAIVQQILETQADTHVYLGSRNLERGNAAVKDLLDGDANFQGRVECLQIDVSNAESVAAAVQTVQAGGKLYGVVHNAGVGDGWENCVNINAIGTDDTAHQFMPLLDQENGCMVFVCSAAGPYYVVKLPKEEQRKWIDPAMLSQEVVLQECQAKLAMDPEQRADNAYGFSKCMNNAIMLYLSKDNPNLKINSCTPGWIETDLTRKYAKKQGKTPQEMGMLTPKEGAQSSLHLLFADLGAKSTGCYYGSDSKRSPLHKYRGPGEPVYEGELEKELGIETTN